MKVLMLTPYLPYPLLTGGQTRSYNLIRRLSKLGHQISLFSLVKNDQEREFIGQLEKFCAKVQIFKRSQHPWTINNILKTALSTYPFLVIRNWAKGEKDEIDKEINREKFDLIHAETFYIMPHIPQTSIPILLVEQTIEYRVYQHYVNNLRFKFLKPLFYFDIIKLKFWEKTFWKRANVVGAVSDQDKKNMRALLPNLKIEIIPNAAGEDLFNSYTESKKIKPVFLYQGNFSWLQNIEAAQILARKVFPKIKEQIPEAICVIAGQNARSKIGPLEKISGVQVIDIDPSSTKKVQEIFKKAAIFLAPIEGPGGTRLKILAAMAAGLPVISSPTGVAGLDVKHNKNVIIAKNAEEFAVAATELLKNNKKYTAIRRNARKLIENKYSWNTISKKLEKIYEKLIRDRKSTRLNSS